MNHEPKIAVVHPDTLAAIGLRQLLQAVMPTLGVDAYRSAGEVPAGQADAYVHYFAAVAAVAAAPQFFAARRRQTIVLSPVPGAPLAGYHSICTSAPERSSIYTAPPMNVAIRMRGVCGRAVAVVKLTKMRMSMAAVRIAARPSSSRTAPPSHRPNAA